MEVPGAALSLHPKKKGCTKAQRAFVGYLVFARFAIDARNIKGPKVARKAVSKYTPPVKVKAKPTFYFSDGETL